MVSGRAGAGKAVAVAAILAVVAWSAAGLVRVPSEAVVAVSMAATLAEVDGFPI